MANVIYMPDDERLAALSQGMLGAGQQYGQALQNQQQDTAIQNLAKLYQQANAPLQAQNQQNQQAYQNINDLTTQLYDLKSDADKNWATWTPAQQSMATQKANAIRNQIASLGGAPALTAGQTADQSQAALTPYVQQDYEKAINPVTMSPDQQLQLAIQAAKGSRGALSAADALSLGQSLGGEYNQQSTAQAQKFQDKYDQAMMNHYLTLYTDAIKNKDYTGAMALQPYLEEYNIKTQDLTKLMEPAKPIGHVTLANGHEGIILPDGTIQDTGTAVYIRPVSERRGRTSDGTGEGTTKEQQEVADKLADAEATMSTYNPHGVLQEDGSYKLYSPDEQIKFNEAANYIKAHDPNWLAQQQPATTPAAQTSTQQQQQTNNNPQGATWYYQTANRIKAENPTMTDQQVKDYMTYLINANGG